PADAEDWAIRRAVLDRLAVGFLVSDRALPDAPWPLAASGPSFVIYRNPTALPRAYVVPRAEVCREDASAVDLFPSVDPRSAVLRSLHPPAAAAGPRQYFGPAIYAARAPDPPLTRVKTGAPGLLVVAAPWMPGWTARLDGELVPIQRGNQAQRVIALRRAGE